MTQQTQLLSPWSLVGFEQDDFVREAGFDRMPLPDLISEFEFLRRANLLAIRYMSNEAMTRRHRQRSDGQRPGVDL